MAPVSRDTDGDKDRYIAELEARLADRDRLAALLADAEQRVAQIDTLKLQIADLEYDLAGVRAAEISLREHTKELDERLMRSQRTLVDVMTSPSWKLTRPLRDFKKILGR